ncbi:MAG: beta strand repeat-containing protein, partial [Gammaproteobacteria bacterium]
VGGPGTFENTVTGTYRKTENVTTTIGTVFDNAGTVEVEAGTLQFNGDVIQHVGNTLTGGTWRIRGTGALTLNEPGAQNIVTSQVDVTLDGAAASFARIDSLTTNQGAFRVLGARNFSAAGPFTNSGILQLGGGTFSAPALSNLAGGEIFGFGTVTPQILNSGIVRANGGNLFVAGGVDGQSGTLQSDPGATLTLGAASDGDFLINGGALDTGGFNVTVSQDYTNANFGIGNGFDARANVLGTGQILAAGDVAQRLTGALADGTTATPILAFGNLHVGDIATETFRVANTGTTGPSLRGALQTTVNGGQITDGRLSGSGVTAANFGPLAVGTESAEFSVTFSGTTAGALIDQRVAVVNNFDNVAGQVLSVTGAVYRLAEAGALADIVFGNVHVGDVVSRTVTLSNAAANDGFSESLSAVFESTTEPRFITSGSVTRLAAGATDDTSLVVGLDTGTAGAYSGTVQLRLSSDGAGSSELGLTDLGLRAIGVSTNIGVYRFAEGAITDAEPVDLGAYRVGDLATLRGLAIGNIAANDGFSERLDARVVGLDPGFQSTGEVSLLGAGEVDTTSLQVRVDTATAGIKSGVADIAFVSNGAGTSLLGETARGSREVALAGRVYAPAVATVEASAIDFGIVHVGDSIGARNLSVRNDAAGELTDTLRGEIVTTPSGFTGTGSLGAGGLAAGASSDALTIALDTTVAGVFGGTATLAFASHNPELSDVDLGEFSVSLAAQVNQFANPVFGYAGAGAFSADGSTLTVDFGTLVQGAPGVAGTLQLSNLVSGPADDLTAEFGPLTGDFTLSGFEPFAALGAGDVHDFTIGFSPLATGSFEQVIAVHLFGENASGFRGALGEFTVTFRAQVAPVPLPPAVWMFGAAAALGLRRRRRAGRQGARVSRAEAA